MTERPVTRRTVRTLLGALVLSLLCAELSHAQHTVRTVRGVVTDGSHEPLKGAVVQVENDETKSVRSYITDSHGAYTFARLDGDADYRVFARFRGKESKSRTVSGFDTHPVRIINLVIRLY